MDNFMAMANSGMLYLIAGVVIAFVMILAAVFLVKAYREGVKIGMDKKKMHKAITSSIAFTVVPSVSILIGVIALSGSLGIPIPWLRLSVIGALHYETMAADVAAKAAGLSELSGQLMNGDVFVSVIFVMTIGIIWGGVFCVFGLKKYQSRVLGRVGKKDNRWGTILFNCHVCGHGVRLHRGGVRRPAQRERDKPHRHRGVRAVHGAVHLADGKEEPEVDGELFAVLQHGAGGWRRPSGPTPPASGSVTDPCGRL